MLGIITGIVLTAGALCILVHFIRGRKRQDQGAPRTYSGPIRTTSPDGRNLKIVQREDGSFVMEEEEPPSR